MPDKHGIVALVTGASRGAGRGIAVELGAAGATVYVTGRSVNGGPTTDGVPGTIDQTADDVSARGGLGIAVRCDHTVDADVDALFDRVRRDHGRLDVLVNNVWGGYEDPACRPLALAPFWEQSLHQWDRMFTAGVRAYLTASRRAVPLMLPRGRGLIVNTTANVGALPYMPNLYYDLAKHTVARLVWAMAEELRPHGIAVVALAPGFMRTERVEEAFRRAGMADRLDGPGGPSETPAYLGRAVVALAADPRVIEKTGSLLEVGVLARDYGFTDVNGTQPPPFRLPAGTRECDRNRKAERHQPRRQRDSRKLPGTPPGQHASAGKERPARMHPDTAKYNNALGPHDRKLCDLLAREIDQALPEAENRVWHAHPVWFLDGNPVVGYSRLKETVRLLFWSGQSFGEDGLKKEGSFKAAEAHYTRADDLALGDLRRWLAKARDIQWDYKNIVRRKGRLVRLK